MGGMGPGFHFPLQLLHNSHVPLLVQLIAGVWQVPAGGLPAQAGRMGRPVGTWPSSLLSIQGRGLFLRKETAQTCIQCLFSCFNLLVLKDSSVCALAQNIRCWSVADLPTGD